VPTAAEDVVAMGAVDEPPAVTEEGANDTLTPAGAPDADSDTDCATPDVTAVLTVVVAELPCTTDPEAGLAEIEKSLDAAAVTVSE